MPAKILDGKQLAQTMRAELAEEVIEFCRARMARFKAPARIVFGPLPKTSTGKIQKFELRERARALP